MSAVLFVVLQDAIFDFALLSYFVIGIGSTTSLFFLFATNEVQLTKKAT